MDSSKMFCRNDKDLDIRSRCERLLVSIENALDLTNVKDNHGQTEPFILIKEARKISKDMGKFRGMLLACLGEYERWLHASISDFREHLQPPKIRQNARDAESMMFHRNREPLPFPPKSKKRIPYVPPSRASASARAKGGRHDRFSKRQANKPSRIPKDHYVHLDHVLLPPDNHKYPARFVSERGTWEQLIFPASHPYWTRDTVLLDDWYSKQAKELHPGERGPLSIEEEIETLLPLIDLTLHEFSRQFSAEERSVGDFVSELWQSLVAIMSVMMKETESLEERHETLCNRLMTERRDLTESIRKANEELQHAKTCTLNLKSDTDVLDRALVARKKQYEKTIFKHRQIAERVGKVIRLAQLMEDAEFTKAYKDKKRMERLEGVPEMMDRLSDILVDHRMSFSNVKSETGDDSNLGDLVNASWYKEAGAAAEQHSNDGEGIKLHNGNTEQSESKEQEHVKKKAFSSVLRTSGGKRTSEKFGSLTGKVGSKILVDVDAISAKIKSLRATLNENIVRSQLNFRSSCSTQTDMLHEINAAGLDETVANSGERAVYSSPAAALPFVRMLPPDFVPELYNDTKIRILLNYVSTEYTRYILSQYRMEAQCKGGTSQDGVGVSTESSLQQRQSPLLEYSYDLFLDSEEVPSIAQVTFANFVYTIQCLSSSNIECSIFGRLANLLDDKQSLPQEAINLAFLSRDFLCAKVIDIQGQSYCTVGIAKELVHIVKPKGVSNNLKMLESISVSSYQNSEETEREETNDDTDERKETNDDTDEREETEGDNFAHGSTEDVDTRLVSTAGVMQMVIKIWESHRRMTQKRIEQTFFDHSGDDQNIEGASLESFSKIALSLQPSCNPETLQIMFHEVVRASKDLEKEPRAIPQKQNSHSAKSRAQPESTGEGKRINIHCFVNVCFKHRIVGRTYKFLKANIEEADASALMSSAPTERSLEKEVLERVKLMWNENSTSIKQLVSLSNVTLNEKIEHLEALLDVKMDSESAAALYEEILRHVQEVETES
jgi:hypothetical protein